MNLRIHSIFRSTEGEGIHIGTPQVFVRFQGCAIACENCDSKETWDFTDDTMTMNEVLAKIEDLSGQGITRIQRVSITGGDPLHPKNADGALALARTLKKSGFYVNIEAAGTRVVNEIFDIIDFISFDFKTPSTGVKNNPKVLKSLCDQYSGKSQIKAVITDKKDFEATFDMLEQTLGSMDKQPDIPWVLTPCYEPGEDFPADRFSKIVRMNEDFGAPFRVIGQQHKMIHGSNKRDV